MPECASDADCAAADACSTPECTPSGTCLQGAVVACPTGQVCDPALGCVEEPTLPPGCDDSFVGPGGAYVVCSIGTDWESASITCESLGAELVTVDDSGENSYLTTVIDAALTSTPIWIGYEDFDGDGTYAWASGAPTFFEPWASGEPSGDAGAGSAAILRNDGYWYSQAIGTTYPFVCER